MMYRARRSFVDPFTSKFFQRGKPCAGLDSEAARYLERHGLIERIENAPAEQQPAGADAFETPKRKKARR